MNKWNRIGWAAAVVVAGVLAAAGFQGPNEKTGTVDLNKCIQQSVVGQTNTAQLNAAVAARKGLVEFVRTYKVLTADEAQKIRDLTLKTAPTDADKAELERVKQGVIASDKKRNELSQKGTGLTDEEKKQLNEFAQRAQMMGGVLEQWNQDFTGDLTELQQKLQQETLDKARAALAQVGKAQGYTVIFESNVAPYSANEVTAAVVKQMDANK
jgi:Skp family chaperone for outer membrane proteins